jgi:NMD protein affecting ribosome stability and mRNA decay
MNNFTYLSGEPVKIGDIVHVRNRPYVVANKVGDHIALYSMDEAARIQTRIPCRYRRSHRQRAGARNTTGGAAMVIALGIGALVVLLVLAFDL